MRVRPEAVPALAARAGLGPQDVCRVVLVVHRQRVRVGANLCTEAPAVLVHPFGLVGSRAAEVERREGALAHPAFACREDDLVRTGRVLPGDHWAISSLAAASSESRPSSSPFSFRRRSSDSTSPTRGDSSSPSSARSAPLTSRRTSRNRSKYSWRGGSSASASANSGASGAYGSASATTSAGSAPARN